MCGTINHRMDRKVKKYFEETWITLEHNRLRNDS